MPWDEEIEAEIRNVSSRLLTLAQFDAVLARVVNRRGSSPIRAVLVELQGKEPMPVVVAGEAGAGEASDVETSFADEQGTFKVRTQFWWATGTGTEAHDAAKLSIRRLVKAWWRGDTRNEKSQLPSGQGTATQLALEQTVLDWIREGPIIFCSADIDNFGNYNNNLGLPAGDALIGRLGAHLLTTAPREALVIHRSGDEFTVVFPPEISGGVAVATIMDLRRQVEMALQDGIDIEPAPGLSCGVVSCARPILYEELEELAGKTLKPGGEKRRGRVTVLRDVTDTQLQDVQASHVQLLLVLSLLGDREPFGDPLLNGASVAGEQVAMSAHDLADIGTATKAALADFADTDDAEPGTDVVLAAGHGLARAALLGEGPSGFDRVEFRVGTEGISINVGGIDAPVAGVPAIAEPTTFSIVRPDDQQTRFDSKRALLVTIGDTKLGLPAELFASVVFVDDRATRGGGLPDLWEAAVAKVVAAIAEHPNVNRVFLAGELSMGRQTVDRLMTAESWTTPAEAEKLAQRIGARSLQRVVDAGKRIAGRVIEVTSASEIVNQMMKDLEGELPLNAGPAIAQADDAPRLLRVLAMDSIVPDETYGFRVDTASEAFPIALEIVRHVEDGTLEDQTGRAFRELVDFHITLRQPLTDPIPRYYRSDAALLDAYFEREFVNSDGLFRSQLEKHGQLAAVVEHTSNVVRDGKYTSRRAVLVVPHEPPPEGNDLNPLGLISIRIIPRPVSPRSVRLDYSFSWRTVEALVGLPYSLYGSIRFSDYLTRLIQQKLSVTSPAVATGRLSYIAHSLHIFTEEFAEQVARRIINDDSR